MVEEVAAVAATFLLFTLLVQLTMAITARSTANAATSMTARRVAVGADPAIEAARLATALEMLVPGAEDVEAHAELSRTRAVVRARFAWVPPGPSLGAVTITTDAEVAVAIPP